LVVEDIWDSIAKSNNQLPLYEWQKKELDKCYSDFKNEKLKLQDWESVHEELRKKYK
jgi:putative addiction module component (TIGR02574 family)